MAAENPERAPAAATCTRCARIPRDAGDRLAWVEIDGDEVCPGCLTLSENEQLRSDTH